ncbi:putative seryl-tRNA synthetase [Lyophyllum shimeji]|uniref:serine--tRNA ligase n=1 Tax=Lyophyllum shimeji TaxID=47721 RepID=A0A9P3PH25_LYOSH|nr:putative seryl-tRNA synthetase [Lyophyllum shimeji]
MLSRCAASVSRSFAISPPFKRCRRCRYSSNSSLAQSHARPTTALPPPRIDYRAIAENVVKKTNNAINRKAPLPVGAIEHVARTYNEHKRLQNTLNAKRNERSIAGERLRKAAAKGDVEAKNAALVEATQLKGEVSELEAALAVMENELLTLALAIPNDTHSDSPLGPESSAVTIATHGPEPLPSNPERDHVAICRKLGLFDLESGSTVTGSSWYYLLNEAALLEIALTNYAMSIAIKHGFTPVLTPDVVRSDIASRCGFQPRDNSDPPMNQMYHLNTPPMSPELVLAGTSEIPLAGMFANKVFPSTTLPLKVVGMGHSFRAEAGARGTDTRGLYRVHQFTKVELFAVTTEDGSEAMMKELLDVQKTILDGLGLPFRILDMPTEELGASAYQKHDMEVWMPGRGSWGEVSSLSNCTDYQARRLHIRYRRQTARTEAESPSSSPTTLPFAHTLNGTAAAVPRLIVALLENGAVYDEHGELTSIRLPMTLKPFWFGQDIGRDIIEWT